MWGQYLSSEAVMEVEGPVGSTITASRLGHRTAREMAFSSDSGGNALHDVRIIGHRRVI
jgi:hypothetical protein